VSPMSDLEQAHAFLDRLGIPREGSAGPRSLEVRVRVAMKPVDPFSNKDRLLRDLAALGHEQWSHWTGHFLEIIHPLLPAAWSYCPFCGVEAPSPGLHRRGETGGCPGERLQRGEGISSHIARWRGQIETQYDQLTEHDQQADLSWAMRAYMVALRSMR